ncbi:DNA-directed RNA polymerase subunit alpha [Candidatus Uhrbacteria bacterium]|nr:DNA-directed RNA polymerase subunit alpha [Candidatus Uhrbacteria bacterium]
MEIISSATKITSAPGTKPNETIVTIEPLYPRFGHTVGVALRRVLLSSLEGGAIVAVKIKGAHHEFSTLPYVKEDVVDIILNLKKLRFKVFSDETVRLSLKVRGEKAVTGTDIESTSDAEVANPKQHICSLTNKNAQVEMELFVKKGRGYLPTEAREKEKLEIGTIAVDALFSPVRNVGLQVENVRVGQMTDYNKIIMNIETDGSVSAEDAVKAASEILVGQFSAIHTLASGDEQGTSAPEEEFNTTAGADESTDEESNEEKEPKKRGRPKRN